MQKRITTPRGPAAAAPARNDPCPCGSGRKFKACCGAGGPAHSVGQPTVTGGALPHHLSAAGAEAAAFTPLQQLLRLQPRTYDETEAQRDVPSDPVVARREANRLHARGTALVQARRYAAAIDVLRRATRLNPDDAAIRHDLGWACLHAARAPEAAAAFRRALALRPDFAPTHNGLGQALEQAGNERAALAAFEHAARLGPKLTDVHVHISKLLLESGRTAEAADALERAGAAAGDNSFGRTCRAKALIALDRSAEAEAVLRRVIVLDPTCVEAHRTLGIMLIQQGRFEEAVAHLDRAVALMPGQTAFYYSLALSRKFGEAERPLLARMLARLEAKDVTERHRMMLHFAAGKALDDLKDYGGAIRQFDAANEIRRRSSPPFERRRFARSVDAMIAYFSPTFFADRQGLGLEDETPVLVVGLPRSGTTLTEQILSSHPRVAGGGELVFWPQRAHPLLSDARPDRVAGAAAQLAEDYLALLREIGPEAARVTDKTPFNFRWLGLIHLALPRARIIHCRRNPIDTCLSIYSRHFAQVWEFASDRGDLAFYYREYRRLTDHWRAVLPPDRFFEVDYEELTADPEPITRRLIEFSGLAWDDACLRPQDNERVVKTASVWQARQPVYRSSVERWRNYEPWIGELRELLPAAPEDARPIRG